MVHDIGQRQEGGAVETLDLASAVGARVRDRRLDRGWTLDELAERSGVSRRMVVNVEQGASNPSIATLLRLGDALGVGLPALVDVERPGALRVIGAGQAPVLWRGTSGGQAALVAGIDPPDVVELWDWTLEPGEAHSTEPHAAGTRELLLVLAGHVQLTVGQQTQLLTVGESAQFAGDVSHGYANPSAAGPTARFCLTVFEPHVGRRGAR
jgi:transcriptional regulator with XRE-family HTH domain